MTQPRKRSSQQTPPAAAPPPAAPVAPAAPAADPVVVLPLHPLVRGLAVGFKTGNIRQAVLAAQEPHRIFPASAMRVTNDVAAGLSDPCNRVVTFAGYLGPTQSYATATLLQTWRVLYQDAKVESWLLVPEDAIVLHDRAKDKRAAFGKRDILWVKSNAPVCQGDYAEPDEARFLVGAFTTAGDLHSSLRDASPPPPGSGILCAPTPDCCRRYTP
jgi:hypothetical protein